MIQRGGKIKQETLSFSFEINKVLSVVQV